MRKYTTTLPSKMLKRTVIYTYAHASGMDIKRGCARTKRSRRANLSVYAVKIHKKYETTNVFGEYFLFGAEWGRGGRKYAPEILAAGQKGVMGKKRFEKQAGPAGRCGWAGMVVKRGRLCVTVGLA